ncbi:ammonium transporter Rh type B-like [Elysia marginata]|uniref:Ammonium transporter Rh type B-like n=1 Tax=Elysia marginata TaxID=1093978 RepID=A0AAV4FII7_9GAST|nr:ammonium transporter Rh type B-like [Elysia marginata]
MASIWLDKLKLPMTLVVLQVLFFILFAVFVDYSDDASPAAITPKTMNGNGTEPMEEETEGSNSLHAYYGMFQDVHVMIFIGFGFLMMFLKRYGFSSVGLNMLIAALAIQWATIIGGLVHNHGKSFTVDVTSMLTADFASAAVLITFGALLGKTSPLQMVIITVVEIVVFSVNEYIGVEVFKAVDIGGSMFVHAFGAYFGLAVSRVLYRDDVEKSDKEGSVYHSDMFAVIGSVFLWMFWPSFNSALAVEDAQHRAVLNTYFALAACCVATFAISSLVDRNGKFDMPFLSNKFKIHDTCGVNNLHGMPAIMAGITGAIVVAMADTKTYGTTLYRQFPAMAPTSSNDTDWSIMGLEPEPGKGRSAGQQAGYQIIALVVTVVIAIVSGLIVGFVLKCTPCLSQPSGSNLFEDEPNWHTPEPEGGVTPELVSKVILELENRKRQDGKGDEGYLPLLGDDGGEIPLEDKGPNGEHV